MLEINLIPQNLRKKKKDQFFQGKIRIPLEIIIGCGGGLLLLLVVGHLLLLFFNVKKLTYHQTLKAKWESILPEKQKVDSVVSEMRKLQNKYKGVAEITSNGAILWSKKLNILSDSLPRSVWLKKIVLNEKILVVEGSAISREAQEVINVHRFTASLKAQEEFLKHFSDFELGSIQRRRIKSVDIADFVITMKLR